MNSTLLSTKWSVFKTGRLWKKYAADNPKESSNLDGYVQQVITGTIPSPPVLKTPTGEGIEGIFQAFVGLPVPPPSNKMPIGVYTDPEGPTVNYSTEWDALKKALPVADFLMAPLDSSVIKHINSPVEWCLVPAGITEAEIIQYAVPCAQAGVQGFVVVDEPGSDPASVALISKICGWIKLHCPGCKTAVTQYASDTLKALAADKLVDILIIDRYPSRDGWNLTYWTDCITVCETALASGQISEFWIVLDAFDGHSQGYTVPTAAELTLEIQKAQATHAARLIIYAWGYATAGGVQLAQLPDLLNVLNTYL